MDIELFIEKFKTYVINTCKTAPYSIVSLGPNCYPRTVLTRTGLMKSRKQGRPTMPFDFAWYHSSKYITDFLSNDFSNFLTDLHYSEYSGSWDSGDRINFSHEAYIGPTEKHRLIQVYRQRINNFRKELKKSKPILFLQVLKDQEVGEDCINTFNELQKLCKFRNFVFVIIDCIHEIDGKNLPKEIYTLQMPFPSVGTDVFSKDFYESEEGKQFEHDIAEFIENIIINEFGMNPIKFS